MSSNPLMFNVRQVLRAIVFVGLLPLLVAAPASHAYGQSFTLTPTALHPLAVDPGSFATATIELAASGGFDSSVSLSCAVTTSQVTSNPAQCYVSPDSAIPDAVVSLTVTTSGSTPAGEYTITVTGTGGSETQTTQLILQVVNAQEDYTLTVSTPINPSSVTPGGGALATVTVTPIAGYAGTVTLSCLSVTPTVVAAPVCSFQATSTTQPQSYVQVGNGVAATAVLTISTYGTTQTTAKAWSPHIFYAFGLVTPGLALVGVGAGGKHRKRLLGLLLLMMVAGGLLMLPSCNAATPTTTLNNTSGLVTPKNTYTFTLTGVDQNGVAPSNTSTAQATVSLTVN